MDRLIRILGENVTERLEGDSEGQSLGPLPMIMSRTLYSGRSSGVIVDTPSSFASSPSSTSTPDHRQTLIRACVDAFRSKPSFIQETLLK
jgi:polyribonucleotide 5'-hydroxyl-kinase